MGDVAGKGFREVKPVDVVLREVLMFIKHTPNVTEVDLIDAVGKYLAEDVYSNVNVPPFNRSAVDGYAVRSIDTFGASPTNPSILRVKGYLPVGEEPGKYPVNQGEAVEIATGAPLPPGADAVVMYENTGRRGDYVEVYRPVAPMDNVSRMGEDVAKGELIFRKGTLIKPWDLGVLASMGVVKVKVYEPKVMLIVTGNELVEVEDTLKGGLPPGRVINSTRFVLTAMLRGIGCTVDYLKLPDDEQAIRDHVSKALINHDAVVTTGGASVGRIDYTIRAVADLKPEYLNHGLAIRPGKPNSVAVKDGKPVFMLSGFPVASLTGFEVLVKPILLHMMNAVDEPRPRIRGILTRRVATPINTRSFVRVRAYLGKDGKVYVEPLALTGSGVLTTLVKGNGILTVPENREGYDEGDEVEVELIRPLFTEQ
ncbi:gephyrin-like molybdotransferase Glp [Caldivirga sp.]|uniref:molybdopterin molybdotransferase MoeA n=1 Tax=Caldivirga sp. TaxID=2080243 RepID=UPI0025B7D8B1|nr:gephyrin-like molybdotransferase Glp [Caldivirga sp.]